ncbi:MAG: cytochrome c biogenesis protein CcsA [Bacteroidota bacterium]
MLKHWWKILSVLIILYVLTVGLLVPLSPGITSVSPQTLPGGNPARLLLVGYNSHFQRAQNNRVWLKLSESGDSTENGQTFLIQGTEIRVQNDRSMTVGFDVPAHFPGDKTIRSASVIIDNEIDGTSVYPGAVFIKQAITNKSAAAFWTKVRMDDLHNRSFMTFPFRNILSETIRNTYFHVPMMFAMVFLFLASVIYSTRYLRSQTRWNDHRAVAYARVGVVLGILGLLTGALWAKWTWGAFWSWDIKQNMSAVALLIYLAYFVLRSSLDDLEQSARISAVFNIFAFAMLIPLIFVIPRLTDSLHPGNGGNPGMGGEDLDNTMRMIFYPAIIGWTLLGFWIANLTYRASDLREKLYERLDL